MLAPRLDRFAKYALEIVFIVVSSVSLSSANCTVVFVFFSKEIKFSIVKPEVSC